MTYVVQMNNIRPNAESDVSAEDIFRHAQWLSVSGSKQWEKNVKEGALGKEEGYTKSW